MSNNHVKWTQGMIKYTFKRLFEILGPLSLYANTKGYSVKEAKAFEVIAKELSLKYEQEITEDKVGLRVYSISWGPEIKPRKAYILTLAAAIESGWLRNEDLLRVEKTYIQKGLMMDLGNYYLVKKL